MPLWTSEELQLCRSLVYPHISEEDVDDSFDQVGGTAREAFDKALLEHGVRRIRGRAQEITIKDLKGGDSAGQRFITNMAGDSLLAIKPDNTYKAFDISFVSSLARSSARDRLINYQRNQLKSIWPDYMGSLSIGFQYGLGPMSPGSVGGLFFEGMAMVSLEDSGKTKREFRRYIFGEGVGNGCFSSHNYNRFDGQEIPSKFSPDTYYFPRSRHFTAIDGLGVCDKALYIFQMKTSGITLAIPLVRDSGLLRRWGIPVIEKSPGESYDYEKCVFVYVVPERVVGAEYDHDFDNLVAKEAEKTRRNGGKRIDGCIWIDVVWVIAV